MLQHQLLDGLLAILHSFTYYLSSCWFVGFGFISYWLGRWREFYQPITERSNVSVMKNQRKNVITFVTQLKTALWCNCSSTVIQFCKLRIRPIPDLFNLARKMMYCCKVNYFRFKDWITLWNIFLRVYRLKGNTNFQDPPLNQVTLQNRRYVLRQFFRRAAASTRQTRERRGGKILRSWLLTVLTTCWTSGRAMMSREKYFTGPHEKNFKKV